MEVKKYEDKDFGEILNFIKSLNPSDRFVSFSSFKDEEISEMMKIFSQGVFECYLIKNLEKIKGFCLVEILAKKKELRIQTFVVSSSERRKGYGSYLLLGVEQVAIKKHLKTITLEVHRENLNAIAFYERQGFSKIAKTKDGHKMFKILTKKEGFTEWVKIQIYPT